MSPRRLIPYLLVFLVLAGAYAGLKWRQEKQATREEQARQVFHLQETEINTLSLVRGNNEVRLVKKNKIWYLTVPLNTKADQTIVDSMVSTLARLRKERDLGVEKDLKPFGLDQPGLLVKFTAQGQPHQLVVGAPAPGGESYYVRRDQDPHLLLISRGSKDSLDRTLLALRDKTLFTFISDEVKGLKVVTDKATVNLEKTGPLTWHWVGRPDFKVRGDKVEKLLRDLGLAQAKNFIEPAPPNLKPLGLVPRRQTEITVVTSMGNQTLFLGAKKGDSVYGRKGADGPVVLVEATLPDEITKTLAALEDQRLWSGAIPEVHQVIWGAPGKTWTATRDKEAWQITGPDHATTQQPSVRLEMALWDFQKLETSKILPQASAGAASPAFRVELRDGAGKPLFHLDEVGPQGKNDLKVVTRVGDQTATALIAQAPFRQWQDEMSRLTATAQKAVAPEQGKSPAGKP
jgi:hypothetical protein